ncbi:cyclic GMP-AMP synthase DncV-like nucleotidyltransferase [Inconstantimicrobium mannanitabidum]|uniref:Uncharacterized protein n=1 Tax=Inconstantimicrobium mannanitabidum TaxID=1604901 RepID=A0ACB5RCM5_9CLOT|nr:nucleotidyltransferase [Clostridium sp. TW13]GKX66895.1 hypothetical protein rsdtw13_21530 [Clostridium sp. TW13]
MASVQKQFEKFHEDIKLKRFEENEILREKRDIITGKIEKGIKDLYEDKGEKSPSTEFIDQGSYSIGTGIIPDNGDYDIDEGIIFDLNKEDFEDVLYFKKMIRDIMLGHTKKEPKIKNPCVTITYSKGEESPYHVDLPIYLKSNKDDNLYLAWGKEFADKANIKWEKSDPKGLKDYINDAFSGDDKKQFRRVVRYLKKWKDIKFSDETDGKPPSIGLTVIAVDKFLPKKNFNSVTGKYEYDDLDATLSLTNEIINCFVQIYDYNAGKLLYTIDYKLPKEPKSNMFFKMTNLKMNSFYEKVVKLRDALEDAKSKDDPHDACTILAKYFGDKFPIPESTQNRYQKVALSSAPASNFA